MKVPRGGDAAASSKNFNKVDSWWGGAETNLFENLEVAF